MTAPLGTLGRYRLVRRLAAGGMGEVYLAELPGVANLSQRVAIKRILPHLARDTEFVSKFIDEAYIMMRLHHGNIVGVHELADQDGELYIVMEYLPGRDLKAVTRRLRQGRAVMPPDLALWLVAEICTALDYAHRKTDDDGAPMHIVHRDVSPSNVLLGAGGEVKLLDFGIARARGRLHQSISGTLQGKFVYMSPEQADGRKVGPASDIYSTGLVLYELLTGVRPFEGESETETLRKVRAGAVEPPSAVRNELDAALDPLIMQALAQDPAARYPSAAAMRRALQHHLADARSHADAQQLGEWLGELFPEGVTSPHGPTGPMSIEDALELQLGALTPNVDPMTRTHTADAGTPSRPSQRTPSRPGTPLPRPPAVQTGPIVGHVSGPVAPFITDPAHPIITDPSFQAQPPATGRKRTLALAVLLGALLAGIGVAWWLNRPAATLDPQVEGPENYTLHRGRGGPELLRGVELPVGAPVELCVQADGFATVCKTVELADGLNPVRFAPKREPQVRLVRIPGDVAVGFTLDGAPFNQGRHPVAADTPIEICVSAPPPGWRLAAGQARCTTTRVALGAVHVFEREFEREADAAPPPPVDAGVPSAPDAAVATQAPVKPPVKLRPQPRAARHVITVEPGGAVLRCGDERYTSFPAQVQVKRDTRCTASLKGFASKSITLKGRRGGRQTLTLPKMAVLHMRAAPAKARLVINGKPMHSDMVRNLQVSPGRVLVRAQYVHEGKTFSAEKWLMLAPGEEKNDYLCVKGPVKCRSFAP